jgi:opacity protein-like surface antigen
MNRTAPIAFALLGLFALAPAQAAEPYRFHAGVLFGASDPDDLPVDGGPVLDRLALDNDYAFGVAAGMSLGGPFRIDAEYLRSSADAESLPALGLTGLDGGVDLQTLMVNLVAEATLLDGAIRPYAGLGAGWANVDIDDAGNDFLRLSGDDDVFAWQGIVGVAFPLAERWTLAVDARYLRIDDVGFEIAAGERIAASGELEATQVIASVRYRF